MGRVGPKLAAARVEPETAAAVNFFRAVEESPLTCRTVALERRLSMRMKRATDPGCRAYFASFIGRLDSVSELFRGERAQTAESYVAYVGTDRLDYCLNKRSARLTHQDDNSHYSGAPSSCSQHERRSNQR